MGKPYPWPSSTGAKIFRDGTRDVLTRVSLIRNISISQPHRAHLDLLERFSLHRLREENSRLSTFNDLDNAWQKILSIQELNKSFYRNLVDWFTWATSEINLARLPDHVIDDREGRNRTRAIQEFTVRLICRLLFSWFLKEMGLISSELLQLYDTTDRKLILTLVAKARTNSWKEIITIEAFCRIFSSWPLINRWGKGQVGATGAHRSRSQ